MEHFQGTKLGRLRFVAVDDGNDPWRFARPDHRTHFGTHSATNHKQSCTSSSFGFSSNSHNACCARIA